MAVTAAKLVMNIVEVKFSRRKSALRKSQFLKQKYLALRELAIEQAHPVVRVCIAAHTKAKKNGRIQELFSHFSGERSFLSLCWTMHGACIWYFTIIEKRHRFHRKWSYWQRTSHSPIFMLWLRRAAKLEGRSWISYGKSCIGYW